MKVYKYGMQQSKVPDNLLGFLESDDDPLDEYISILLFDRMLTVEQEREYRLDYLGEWRLDR